MFDWDENKRISNLEDHPGFDFQDADLVFCSEEKQTDIVTRSGEQRFVDFAEVDGNVFVLVYTYRVDKIRIISYRFASRKERERYYENLD